jgi:hypothetical protein
MNVVVEVMGRDQVQVQSSGGEMIRGVALAGWLVAVAVVVVWQRQSHLAGWARGGSLAQVQFGWWFEGWEDGQKGIGHWQLAIGGRPGGSDHA